MVRLKVGEDLTVSDQANHCGVVSKLNDGVGDMRGHAVLGVHCTGSTEGN